MFAEKDGEYDWKETDTKDLKPVFFVENGIKKLKFSGNEVKTPKPYIVSISGPTNILLPGTKITISGDVRDSKGNPLGGETIGVNDGLMLFSTTTKTDKSGRISYNTTVNTNGAAVVEFVVRGSIYPFVFQAATKSGNVYKTNSLNISGLAIRNTSSQDLKAITSVYNGIRYTHRIAKNETQIILQTIVNQAAQRVTVFGGATFSVGIVAGGEISVTIDNSGVVTASGAVGVGPFRGQAYATSQDDLGACWAPGGDLGVTPVSLSGEVALCGGTDGISLGASGSVGGATGGFSIQLLKW